MTSQNIETATIPEYKTVVIVTSTYGDGGPPENAEKFSHWLEHEPAKDFLK